ncbi:MAG: hypothetical protein IKY26_08500 [Erysipelotrichaceae bacterium]|nr:hypothetical protein [Erysipelotrichaceae bacterium]
MKLFKKDNLIKSINKIVIIKDDMQIFNPTEEMVLEDGWLEVEPIDTVEADANAQHIANLKQALSRGDYKVIKCMEAILCGEELPYDINVLHGEREAIRKEINDFENI